MARVDGGELECSWGGDGQKFAAANFLGPGLDPGEPEVEFRESVLARPHDGAISVSRATSAVPACSSFFICHFRSSGVHGRSKATGVIAHFGSRRDRRWWMLESRGREGPI